MKNQRALAARTGMYDDVRHRGRLKRSNQTDPQGQHRGCTRAIGGGPHVRVKTVPQCSSRAETRRQGAVKTFVPAAYIPGAGREEPFDLKVSTAPTCVNDRKCPVLDARNRLLLDVLNDPQAVKTFKSNGSWRREPGIYTEPGAAKT